MKFKEIFFPMVVMLGVVVLTQHFLGGRPVVKNGSSSAVSGESYVAPKVKEIDKPLNLEVDFQDKVPDGWEEQSTSFTTDIYDISFSNAGAVIKRLSYKDEAGGTLRSMVSIGDDSMSDNRENGCMLLALQEATPYHYQLKEVLESDDDILIAYSIDEPRVSIIKTFRINRHQPIIELGVVISPKGGAAVSPRLLFISPFLKDVKGDIVNGVVNYGQNEIKQYVSTGKIAKDNYWVSPTIFGAGDHYFLHAVYKNTGTFAKRAYYKQVGGGGLISFLEGPKVTSDSVWTLGFYFGPKEEAVLVAADPQLEKTLDYGWLSPLAKLLMLVLTKLNDWIHSAGLAILLLAFLIRLILAPFTMKSEEKLKKHAELQKKLKYVQQKYKNDQERLSAERAELIKKHGMPGLGGCLPLLLQFPIFIALSRVLSNSVYFYQIPFLWIPNLAAPDPFYILPVLTGLSALAIKPTTSDVRQNFTSIAIGLILFAVSMSLASGLSLYMCAAAAFGLLQTKVQKRFF